MRLCADFHARPSKNSSTSVVCVPQGLKGQQSRFRMTTAVDLAFHTEYFAFAISVSAEFE